jgi:hypothetical protein
VGWVVAVGCGVEGGPQMESGGWGVAWGRLLAVF